MFDWFWEFLYGISKMLMKCCDWIMACANVLIGIDPIIVDGENTDLLIYLLTSDKVTFAFGGLGILAVVLDVVFAVVGIVRNIAKEDQNVTPAKIAGKAAKNLLMFMLVPLCMVTLSYFMNTLIQAIYEATSQGSTSIGSFLFTCFSNDAGLSDAAAERFLSGDLDYYNTDTVESYITLKNFSFILSWIVSFVVLKNLAESLIAFVERAISIVILYIAAPFSIAASVIDEGAHFKTWREQCLIKFASSYGIIVAINIYCMISSLVMSNSVHLFNDSVLNYVAKVLFILAGAVTVKRSNLLIQNLLSPGAAADYNDPTNAHNRALAGKAFSAALTKNPVSAAVGFGAKAFGGAVKRKMDNLQQKLGNSMLNALGIGTDYDTNRLNGTFDRTPIGGSDSENNNKPNYNKENDLKEALEGGKNNGDNTNGNNPLNSPNAKLGQVLSGESPKEEKKEEE